MKMSTTKKSLFKRVVNIILAVLMGIVSVISISVFTLACIGSCSSKTATVKADNSVASTASSTDIFKFGAYFSPTCSWIKRTNTDNPLNTYWYPNVVGTGLNQTFLLSSNITIRNVDYLQAPIGYTGPINLPCLDITCYMNVFTRARLQACLLYPTGYDTGFSWDNDNRYGVLAPISEPLTGYLGSNTSSNLNTYSNGVVSSPVYLFLSTVNNGIYGCLKYRFNPSFDCSSVRSLVYSSSSLALDSDKQNVFGPAFSYSYDIMINTLTFYDTNNNFFAIDFMSSDARTGGGISPEMQTSRTVYFNPGVTDEDVYNEGYNKGYQDGYNVGNSDSDGSYQSGYESGYSAGESAGYSKGFQDGASGQLTYGGFFSNVLTIFDVPIFGFISLGDIFKFVFVIAMGIWALKLFAGG